MSTGLVIEDLNKHHSALLLRNTLLLVMLTCCWSWAHVWPFIMELDTFWHRSIRLKQFWVMIGPFLLHIFLVPITQLARGEEEPLVSGTVPCYSVLLVILSLLARLSISKTVSMGWCKGAALPVLCKWTLMFIEDLFGSSWKLIIKTSKITQQYVEVW